MAPDIQPRIFILYRYAVVHQGSAKFDSGRAVDKFESVFLLTSGDWGLFWASNSYPGSTRSFKTMPSMRLHLLRGVTWFLCPYLGALTSLKSHGLYAWFWLVEKNFAALWLVGTYWRPPYYWRLSRVKRPFFVVTILNVTARIKVRFLKMMNLFSTHKIWLCANKWRQMLKYFLPS